MMPNRYSLLYPHTKDMCFAVDMGTNMCFDKFNTIIISLPTVKTGTH